MTPGSITHAERSRTDARAQYVSAHQRGRAIAELCRLQIARVPWLIWTATALAAGAPLRTLAAGWALIGASCAIGATLNDRADVTSDRLNHRQDRPLASGVLDGRDVAIVIGVASIVIMASQFALPQPAGLSVTMLAAFVAWASACEPLSLQRRGLIGLLSLATGYLVLPILLALGTDQITTVAPLAVLGAGVLAHKDVRDEVGDRGAGKRTLLVQRGYRRMAIIAALLGLVGMSGLWFSIGAGPWLIPAGAAVVGLVLMAALEHTPARWTVTRGALVVAAILVGIQAAHP